VGGVASHANIADVQTSESQRKWKTIFLFHSSSNVLGGYVSRVWANNWYCFLLSPFLKVKQIFCFVKTSICPANAQWIQGNMT
jgi:hypothetical protein